jgi:hypothetical protein
MGQPAKPIDPSPLLEGEEDDPILAAIRRAPRRDMTDQERELLAELDSQPQGWLTTEEFMASVGSHINRK